MKVYYGRKSRKSGRLLQEALRGIEGPSINFGYQREGEINPSHAIYLASSKRRALEVMAKAEVPTPTLNGDRFPVVARPDKHRAGKHFWLCWNREELNEAYNLGATHHLKFIEGGREFRVHVAFGKSIKLVEKIGGDPVIKNHAYGSQFMYPHNFSHKKSLRKWARKAVESLGLDFGAVDVIYKEGKFYVLEVNSAPSLTSENDTLGRYVRAFVERSLI